MDQGYAYSVRKMKDLPGFDDEARIKPFGYSTPSDQDSLLMTVLARRVQDDVEVESKETAGPDDADAPQSDNPFERREGNMASYSGAQGMSYQEAHHKPSKKSKKQRN